MLRGGEKAKQTEPGAVAQEGVAAPNRRGHMSHGLASLPKADPPTDED